MITGIPASKGYAIGHIVIKEQIASSIPVKQIENIEEEKNRLNAAMVSSINQLKALRDKVVDNYKQMFAF